MKPYNDFKIEEEEEEEKKHKYMDTMKTANLLLSLSLGSHVIGKPRNKTKRSSTAAAAADGVFECKTCSRRFATFQALGGHRTSHNRARSRPDGLSLSPRDASKARVHACALCGAGFAMGQALGGHMRRHRATEVADLIGKNSAMEKVVNLNESSLEAGCSGGSEYRLLELFV
ncbi:zinc finger protein ZAT11-like [Ananas comosus]|uniref:Zinc finger protein ZAT11-like n=1 Tax=Ananas comosus TaxID=4615 RepID=A0A6P5G1Z3_ANACO|nr:zinc finger protein ZAT11-like [Ananas comosus]